MSLNATVANDSTADEGRRIAPSLRGLLLLFVASSVLWLIVGGLLQLINSIQAHTPVFYGLHEVFTYGRLQAAAETALLYGWVANAGFAIVLWTLQRLSTGHARGVLVSLIATAGWNLAVTFAVVAATLGSQTGYAFVQIPGYLLPILVVACLLMGAPGLFAWADRCRDTTYVSHAYGALSLFVLPWILLALVVSVYAFPVRGVLNAIVAAWAGQSLAQLWVAPVVLAALYYLIPKLNGRAAGAYAMAGSGFWIMVVFAPWAGVRTLSGGPVPVWIPSVGIVAGFALLCHFLIVYANLSGAQDRKTEGPLLGFLKLSLVSYFAFGLIGCVSSLRSVSQYLQFTYWTDAVNALLLAGVFTPAAFAVIYYMIPTITDRPWASEGLVVMHYRATLFSLIFTFVGLGGAGVSQGLLMSAQELDYQVIAAQSKPWLLLATAGVGLQLLGAMFLAVNLVFHWRPSPMSTPVTTKVTTA